MWGRGKGVNRDREMERKGREEGRGIGKTDRQERVLQECAES